MAVFDPIYSGRLLLHHHDLVTVLLLSQFLYQPPLPMVSDSSSPKYLIGRPPRAVAAQLLLVLLHLPVVTRNHAHLATCSNCRSTIHGRWPKADQLLVHAPTIRQWYIGGRSGDLGFFLAKRIVVQLVEWITAGDHDTLFKLFQAQICPPSPKYMKVCPIQVNVISR